MKTIITLIFILFFIAYFNPTFTAFADEFEIEYKNLPVNEYKSSYEIVGEVTAYNAEVGQTDDRPREMANGKEVSEKSIACPAFIKLGSAVELNGKIYLCEDRMGLRYRNTNNFDIYMESKKEAIKFGRQTSKVKIYPR
jgi:3D (Asp-Asp-Asp) domain-containing protein